MKSIHQSKKQYTMHKILRHVVKKSHLFTALFLCCFTFIALPLWAEDIDPNHPAMNMYSKVPPFLSAGVKPSVMLMFDNSWNMYRLAYQPQTRDDSIVWKPKFSGKAFDHTKKYYGLFASDRYYRYNKGREYFEQAPRSSTGANLWSGNFLNWLTMRRIDIVKKVLTGGMVVEENGEVFLKADNAANEIDMSTGPFIHYAKGNDPKVTPYNDREIRFRFEDYKGEARVAWTIDDEYLWFRAFRKSLPKLVHSYLGKFRLKIKVPDNEVPKIKGVIQQTASSVRYGLTFFNQHDKNLGFNTQAVVPCRERERENQGGVVKQYIGANINNIIKNIRESRPGIRQPVLSDYSDDTNVSVTPLAETLYTITGYFKKDPLNNEEKFGGWSARKGWYDQPHCLVKRFCSVGPRYNGSLSYTINDTWDPFYFNELQEKVHCSKAFVLLLSAGKDQNDWNIPKELQKRNYVWKHEYYLGNIARYARHTDLRPDLKGKQNLTLYPIYAFGNSEKAFDILVDAAKQGGFDNESEVKYKEVENDNGDTVSVPTNFFYASDGEQLVNSLQDAIEDIKKTSTSNTSVAILDNSIDGSGATFQAVYYPLKEDDNGKTVAWAGDIYALLIDSYGNFREDTNHNQKLDLQDDLIIVTKKSQATGTITVSRYKDANGNGFLEEQFIVTDKKTNLQNTVTIPFGKELPDKYKDKNEYTVEKIYSEMTEQTADDSSLESIAYLWSARKRLAALSAPESDENYLSKNSVGRYIRTWLDKNNNGIVDSQEVVSFDKGLAEDKRNLGYFLGTDTGSIRDFNDDGRVTSTDLEILIGYIRGQEYAAHSKLRSRQHNGEIWRLGDIINSTPVVVQAPFAGYDTLYNDENYRKFKRKYSDRRTVIYTGSNDGIFHAFNGGFYQKEYSKSEKNKFWKYCQKNAKTGKVFCSDDSVLLGKELWAYIPQNLLPHLQWLPQKNYQHVYYNDLQPSIFEAQLWPENDPIHVGGYGTLLVGGMRFGGGPIAIDAGYTGGFAADSPNFTDKRIMRSAYFLMDITDPEQPPVLLDEFTLDSDDRASFTTVRPSLEYITHKNNTRDWFLVFGTGPTTLQGESKQNAQVFIRKLPSLDGTGQGKNGHTDIVDNSNPRSPAYWDTSFLLKEENSFIGNFCGADFQTGKGNGINGAFSTDAIYFGTVAGAYKVGTPAEEWWSGKMHRIVIENGGTNSSTRTATNAITNWKDTVLFDAGAPISAKPLVSLDDKENIWVYFGTGRFYAPFDREYNQSMTLYGIKEPTNRDGIPTYPDKTAINRRKLQNSSNLTIYAKDREAFTKLEKDIDGKSGWYIDLEDKGERLLVAPVIYDQMINFNTFIPSTKICQLSNEGYIYDLYYKTGTAFWKPSIGTDKEGVSISKIKVDGTPSSSSFHSGEEGVKQLIQLEDGSIKEINPQTPGGTNGRSGRIFWEERNNN